MKTKEQKKIVCYRTISAVVTTVMVIMFIVSLAKNSVSSMLYLYGVTVGAVFFVTSFFVHYKRATVGENTIEIYAGYYHHYLKVNGETVDEHNSLIYFLPIVFETVLTGGDMLKVTITLSNGITVKINDKLFKV